MKIGKTLEIDVTEKLDIHAMDMTLYSSARWLALIRGIEVIDKKAQQLNIDLESNKKWVKPLALQKYVDEETPACVTEVKTLLENEE